MSGSTNPFRRRPEDNTNLSHAEDEIASAATRYPTLDTAFAQRPHKGKTVRIVSPHSSTSEDSDRPTDTFPSVQSQHFTHLGSPPPTFNSSNVPKDTSPLDPFNAASGLEDTAEEDDLDGEEDNETGSLRPHRTLLLSPESSPKAEHSTSVPSKAQRTLGMQMPPNPSQKTLTSSRELGSEDYTKEKTAHSAIASKTQSSATARTTLDVEAFKRLLLTGDKESSSDSIPTSPPPHALSLLSAAGDSSSNTDASSLSRQSIFEQVTESHIETPRTSHEVSPSDDESQRLVNDGKTTTEKRGFSTPRTRNGKLVKINSPQTVSFTDSAVSRTDTISRPSTPTMQSKPTPTRSATDLNKPLPWPPTAISPEYPAANLAISRPDDGDIDPGSPTILTMQKRIAPLPPPSRRHSQRRSQYAPAHSEMSTSIEEEKPVEAQPVIASKPPAPPPPRRRGTDRSLASTEALSMLQRSRTPSQSSDKSANAKPPLPPARNTSSASAKRPVRAPSSAITTAMAPPPLPPPRRRGSSASSYSARSMSGDHGYSSPGNQFTPHPPSESVESTTSSTGEKDIMADLSALQREVDALRGKYQAGSAYPSS